MEQDSGAKDVVQDAQEQPSENASPDKGIQDSEDVFDKEGQHQMPEDEQVWQDELEMMVTQELVANAMNDESRQAFEEEKRRIAHLSKKAKLIYRAASTSTGANADESSFVYLGGKIPIDASTLPNVDLPIDPNMPDLEDASDTLPNDGIFNGAYDDDEDVGAVADFNNMDNTIAVSPIPTLRIYKDHPKGQILGDPTSAVQTRGKIQKASSAQQALVSYIHKQNRTNHKDHQNCLFACFLSQEEPKTISQALKDESWVEAMQEELLQFKLQQVWILVDLPFGKKAIGTKWVFRNKRDKRSIVVKNKARLVAQGHRQEEMNRLMNEVFARVARIEAIRLFLAFASYKGFLVYQMDVKSAFIYDKIEEEMYVHQPPGFKLVRIHSFFPVGEWDFRKATTPIELNKPLVKDEDGVEVDVHEYRSMIGSLMYLTASRPYIIGSLDISKHQPKLGLWYPRDSPFELEAFSDSDYAGASLDRKLTTGGCQFLGKRLIPWQCKKQTIMEYSTTEAEYVAAAHYEETFSPKDLMLPGDIVPLLPAMLAGVAVDQGEGSAQPAEPHDTPIKDAVNVAVQLKSNKLREEAQAENDEFLKQIDLNIKAIIKNQVKAQVSKIMPKVLRKRSGKEESSKEATQKESKSTSSSKGASRCQPKSSGKSAQAEEHGPRVDDFEEPLHQEFNIGNDDVSPVREIIAVDDRLWNPLGSQTLDSEGNKTKTNARGRQVIPFDHFINNDLEYLKGGSLSKLTNLNLDERFALNVALRLYTRHIVIQERVEDLQLAVESYQKNINLSRPDSYHSDLRKITPYTAYHNIQGIIYQDDMDRIHLMCTDELHKFSDSTLNHVRTALNDIATRIQMEYLPKRKWSKQDKKRAQIMINAIDKKLRDRRLMHSLEKFVGRRPYGGDLRLLQRTI
ncbi:putative ribonuclease H-like domain-containing protein [Tanacetum coccineum]